MPQLFANNAFSSLGASLSAVATSLTLAAGTGTRFPSPTGGDHFLLTLAGLDGNGNENAWEIVRVTARSTDTLTVVRAQEGTTAALWASGTRVELRATKGTFDGLLQLTGGTITGPVTVVNGAYTALKVGVTGLVSVGGEAGSADSRFTITNGGAVGLEFSQTAIAGENRILSYNRLATAFVPLSLAASSLRVSISGTDRFTIGTDGTATFTNTVNAARVSAQGTTPYLQLNDTDGPADKKFWRWYLDAGAMRLENVNDAYTAVLMTPIIFNSSGGTTFAGNVNAVGYNVSAANYLIGGQGTGDAGTFGFTNANGPGVVAWGSGTAGAGNLQINTGGVERLAITPAGLSAFRNSTGFGYGAGSGGTVTQATSKSTAVTLNKPSGQITMHNAALAAGAVVTFDVNNSTVAASDSVSASFVASLASVNSNYSIHTAVGTGKIFIAVRNESAGSLSEAVPIQFNVIKGSTS